jgi:hypothetical protein
MVGTRHHHLAAGRLYRGRDLGRVGGDRHPADSGLLGPPQHVDDHRQAADVQQRFAGQASCRHAGRNQHQDAGFGHRHEGFDKVLGLCENRPEIMGMGGKSARLYGLPEPGQTDISTLLRVRRES